MSAELTRHNPQLQRAKTEEKLPQNSLLAHFPAINDTGLSARVLELTRASLSSSTKSLT
jgi:hypothetical protein